MIAVQVNGKRVELEGPTPLLEYLGRLGVNPRAVAVEHNGEIVQRPAYVTTTLGDGDRVEIVRMVGGGHGPPARETSDSPDERALPAPETSDSPDYPDLRPGPARRSRAAP